MDGTLLSPCAHLTNAERDAFRAATPDRLTPLDGGEYGSVELCDRCGRYPVCYRGRTWLGHATVERGGYCHRCHVDLTGPTRAVPGSAAKMAVLGDRAALGLPLWHPGDLRGDELCVGDADGRAVLGVIEID